MKEYRLPKKSQITATVFSIVSASFTIGFLMLIVNGTGNNTIIYNILLVFAINTVPTINLFHAFTWKLILTDNSIIKIGWFKGQKMLLSDIKSYKITGKTVSILPIDDDIKPITLPISIDGYDDLIKWLKEAQKTEIVSKNSLGIPIDTYYPYDNKILNEAEIAFYILHAIAFFLAAYLLVWRDDYQIAWSLCIIFPLLPYWVYRRFNGFMQIAPTKNLLRPSIGIASIVPCVAMTLALNNYQYQNTIPLYIYGCVFSTVMLLIFLRPMKKNYKNEYVNLILSGIYILSAGYFYGYGLSAYINSQCDNSKEYIYKANVLNKYQVHSTKTTTEYIVLAPWGPQTDKSSFSVDDNTYNKFSIGDTALIKFKLGALGIPWYIIAKRENWVETVTKL